VCGRAFASRPPTRTYYGSWAVISARSPARTSLNAAESTSSRPSSGRSPAESASGDHRRELVALGRSDHSHERGLLAARLAQPCRRATDTRLRIHRIERRLTVPVASAAALRPGRSLTRSAGASSTSGRGWRGSNDASKTGESRSAGEDPVSRRPVTISMLPASAKPPGGSGGRPSASSSAPTARPSAPRQPDGPLAPDEHWLELRLRRPSSTSPIVPVADTGSRARSSSPTAVRSGGTGRERRRALRRLLRPGQAPLVISTPRGRSPTASLARTWSTCARAP